MTAVRKLRCRRAATLACAASLVLSACSVSLPHVAGMGSYYAVTDTASGRVYYADKLSREDRGVVEFRDGATGAWVSLESADVREIGKDEFLAGAPR